MARGADDWYAAAAEARVLLAMQGHLEVSRSAPQATRDERKTAWYAAQIRLASRLEAIHFKALDDQQLTILKSHWKQARGSKND